MKMLPKFSKLPDEPGVYMFIDSSFKSLYIGKAKSIKKRVMSHFRNDKLDSRHLSMILQVKAVNYIITKNESEALILEDKFIKQIKPKFNIALKDDKTYPYITITKGDEFPMLKITRKNGMSTPKLQRITESTAGGKSPDCTQSVYFGPFPYIKDIRAAEKILNKIFPLRKCPKVLKRKKPCLNYQLGKCLSPCTFKISVKEYNVMVNDLIILLSDSLKILLKKLEKRMNYFKDTMQYEKAAGVRDQINILTNVFPAVQINSIKGEPLWLSNGSGKEIDILHLLGKILNLNYKPEIIEGFDVSHTSFNQATASSVRFIGAKSDKTNYRNFKIKLLQNNEIKMLKEAVKRRLSRLKKENLKLPDVILVDGGIAHEKAARDVIKKLGLTLEVLSLAKEKANIYYKGQRLVIDKDSDIHKLLKKISNEAHRFARQYHIKRRSAEFFN